MTGAGGPRGRSGPRRSLSGSCGGGTRFGHPDFAPSFEALEEHSGCYEMVFILNDDGFGISIFIPKTGGIDADLLAMCAMYAEPVLTQP